MSPANARAVSTLACAKFDAWSEVKGMAAKDAMQQYVDLVASLRN